MPDMSVDSVCPAELAIDQADIACMGAISALLETVCGMTGMGFAAVARVIQGRSMACAVRDAIGLNVQPGDELKCVPAIDHQAGAAKQAIVISNLAEHPCHPSLQGQGFQSCLFMPIVLKDGSLWGGLCAVGPHPARLDNPSVLDMVKGFAHLIALHLDDARCDRLHAAERLQHRFQLALEDQLRAFSNPLEMMARAAALLGEHLGVDHVGFGEMDDTQTQVSVLREWNGAKAASMPGTWRLDDFAPAFSARLKQGQTVALQDGHEDWMASGPTPAFNVIKARAILGVPYVRAGRLLGILFVRHAQPRTWDEAEVAIVETTCARLWSLLESTRADARLRESEERLRVIFTSATVGLSEVDPAGRFIRVNSELCRILGRSEAEMLQLGVADITYVEDLPPTLAAVEQAIRTGSSTALDKRYCRPDGSLVWANSSIQRIVDAAGLLGNLLVATVDLTQRKDAEEALRASEEFNRRVLASSADCIKVLDLDARLEFMTEGGMCVMEVDDFGAIQGACWPDLWQGEEHGKVLHAVAEAKEGRIGRFQGFAKTMKGAPRWWDVIVTPVMGPNGVPEKLLSTSRDVTATKLAEVRLQELNDTLEVRVQERTADLLLTQEALRQAQKMEAVGQLTGGLAHDFNNLLAGISGSLELLQTRLRQGRFNEVDRYIDAAQSASKRAAALTHRLLAFSRRQTLDPKPTNVNRLVSGMEDLIRRTVGPSIQIEFVGASGLWLALVDPPQLENALLNLSINARDAMPHGGRITIETANRRLGPEAARQLDMIEGQYLSVCVTDTGTGMSRDVMERVFEPFFTTKPLGEGTGLGLSMIYGFAQQSGGQVRIQSEVGNGTTVCIYLPRHDGPDDAESVEERGSMPKPSVHEATVLVVDDEPTVRMLVTDILRDLGYAVLEASDSATALKILRSDVRIDLLVTDVGLPGGMNGRQMADAAREVRPGLQVLFITGYAENAVMGDVLLDKGMAVLTKPFAVDVIASRIREMIPS